MHWLQQSPTPLRVLQASAAVCEPKCVFFRDDRLHKLIFTTSVNASDAETFPLPFWSLFFFVSAYLPYQGSHLLHYILQLILSL